MAKKPARRQTTDGRRTPNSGAGKLDAPARPRRRGTPRRPARETNESPRERLQRERNEAIARLQQLRVSPDVGENAPPRLNESTIDEGDAAQASERRDMSFTTRERIARRVERLTAALERIERGTYGRCVVCGRPIEPQRLAAIPETTTCLTCQQRQEQGRPPQEAA